MTQPTNIVPLHPRTTGRPAIVARFALAMLLVAFGLALMLGLFHRSTSTPQPVVLVPSSATLPLPADQVDPTPAPTVTPDTTPTTAAAPAPAQIGTAITVTRTAAPAPTTVATPGPQPYEAPVMHRDPQSGYCFGAGAQDLPAEDAADPTCPTPPAPTTTTIPEATPEQIAAPLASLYPTVPGYAPAQPHEGSSAAPGQHYPTCWTGCSPSATPSTTAPAAG